MQSVFWILYILGLTIVVASPLPFPQSTSNEDIPQPGENDDNSIGLPSSEVLKDLSLVAVGALGTKFFYDARSRGPPNNSGRTTTRSRKRVTTPNQPKRSGASGFNLENLPFHEGDEFGQKFRQTMTTDEIKKWEECVEKHGGKRKGTAMSTPDLDIFIHCYNEIRIARKRARLRADRIERAWGVKNKSSGKEDRSEFSLLEPVRDTISRVGKAVREAADHAAPSPLKGFNGGVSIPAAPIRLIP